MVKPRIFQVFTREFWSHVNCTMSHGPDDMWIVNPRAIIDHAPVTYCERCNWVQGEWIKRPVSDFPNAFRVNKFSK